ncbi:MAG: WecB/TagA/CpsF family glycosyltransferase [Kiritimatiellae bacterium]|nr:WecB/TagA/CpsF family glycosyltransferase [Kiritimatiellia bacterium]
MRLLVSCVPYDGGKSGISVYVREVVAALAAQGHELTLLCEPGEELRLGRETLDDRRGKTSRLASDVPCQIPSISAPRWTRRPALSMLWHLFVLPFWIRRHRGDFDGFFICAANRRVCAFYPLPTAATVHDLANFHIPGKYSRLRMFYLAHVLPHYAKKAQHLVAVSGATKADMVKFWHCRADQVTVLYNGLSRGRDERDQKDKRDVEGERAIASISSIANIPSSSAILYISRIEHPGKNHVRLIEAYSRLPRETAAAHPLALAGADWKDAEVVHEAAKRSPNAAFIRFTGFVTGEKLAEVWAEAGFYVFPSLFEGFGLSLIEAMAQGIPCACSNNGSLGEIAGDVALTFDPYDVDSIAEALKNLLDESQEARVARVARGREWIKRFSWEDHARGIAKLLGQKGVSRLFGIPVARVTEAEAVGRIVSLAKERRGKRAAFVATLNVDFVANAVSGWPFGGNNELWGYLRNADFVTADGMPIVLLSKMLGMALPERVTGADMVPQICRRCAEEGLSVYVLGGDRDVLDEAFAKMDIPNLKIAGLDPAFVKLDVDQPEIVERINAAKPDILFVALGNPKQELWMGRNKAKLDVGAMIGVGGTFNFLAGRVKRAPRWMQKSGLEWVYRIVQEPGRLWRRYAYGLVKFSWLSLLHVLGGYRK